MTDITNGMNELNVRGLTRQRPEESDAVATYMVPYGLLHGGTPSDMLHCGFDMHPVWLESLQHEIRAATVYDEDHYVAEFEESTATSKRKIQIEAVVSLHRGQTMHPHMMQCSRKSIRMYLHTPPKLEEFAGHVKGDIHEVKIDRESVAGVCQAVNTDPEVSSLSGELDQLYGITMHNAERMFQACVVMAARMHIEDGPSVLEGVVRMSYKHGGENAIACACIANAMAAVEIGGTSRVSVAYPLVSQPKADTVLAVLDTAVSSLIKAVSYTHLTLPTICSV